MIEKYMTHTFTYREYLVVTLSLTLLCAGSIAFAQETTREEMREERQETREEVQKERMEEREAAQEKMAEARAALKEKVQERVYNLTQNIVRRLDAAIERFRAIGNRIEARARLIKERGGNTDEALGHLEEARASLVKAREVTERDLLSFVGTEKPQESFATTKASIKEAVSYLKDARESLRKAITSLKSAASTVGTPGVSEAVAPISNPTMQ